MLIFKRGGKGLIIGGLFLMVVGAVLGFVLAQKGSPGAQELLASGCCLIFGACMLLFFARVEIDPKSKIVRQISGFRLAPKTKVNDWADFDAVVAHEPKALKASDASYAVYLREAESQENSILIQQYQDLKEMQDTAKKVAEIMGLPTVGID